MSITKLLVDSNRDGNVTLDEKDCDRWVWGPTGSGAIMFVNNDRDDEDTLGNSEYVDVIIAPPGNLPVGHSLRISTTSEELAKRFALFEVDGASGNRRFVLGIDGHRARRLPIVMSPPLNVDHEAGLTLQITGWRYPDSNFDGYVILNLQLIEDVSGAAVDSSKVVLRVAPWIMLPHTQGATHVYASDVSGSSPFSNTQFITDLKSVLDSESPAIPLTVASKPVNRSDRWMQDELEIGYSKGPSHAFPVVCDLPRDRGLDAFPETLQAPDFGWFSLPRTVNTSSLDYGGNLEVTPPFTAHGIEYPLGRIVYGTGAPFGYPQYSTDLDPLLRTFLKAQAVQPPIELFSDWLQVGHIDEVISFIPCRNRIGFVVASASVTTAKRLLEDLEANGFGGSIMFAGKQRYHFSRNGSYSTSPADISVHDLLSDKTFWERNAEYEHYQQINERILQRELELNPDEIVPIPALFQAAPAGKRTVAYFPGMVNCLVLGGKIATIVGPKPFGPKDSSGLDVFEKAFQGGLPWTKPVFVDDWSSYHELSGEVHCGTNSLREIPPQPWWESRIPGLNDHS